MTHTPFAVFLLSLALALPALAGGDPTANTAPAIQDLPAVPAPPPAAQDLPAVSAPPPATEPEAGPVADLSCNGDPGQVVGHVVAMGGAAHAQRAGEDPRSLSCNDAVHACETIVTSPGARVGLSTSDVYVQIDTRSRLQIGADGDGRGLILHRGGLRVIDTRGDDAAALQVTTPHLAARTLRSDTEFWVSDAGSTRICNHSESVQVAGHGAADSLGVATGCAVSGGQIVSVQAHAEPSISVQDTPSCEVEIAGLFTPTDVAAPQFGGSVFPDVGAADKFRRDACEASNCPNRVTPTPRVTPRRTPRRPRSPRIVVDPDVGTGCGGALFVCGGND